jgi:hypothetical protein
MTYDQWKCSDPNEPYYDEPECDHEEYESDILTGRAECCRCGYYWYQTTEEIERDIERQARYQKDMDRENRRQWWRDKTYPVRMFFFRLLERVWPRKALSVLHDDEIPF